MCVFVSVIEREKDDVLVAMATPDEFRTILERSASAAKCPK